MNELLNLSFYLFFISRVECQVLSALHSENRISIRFPIGKENLIKGWTKEDVQTYHNLHYRPGK